MIYLYFRSILPTIFFIIMKNAIAFRHRPRHGISNSSKSSCYYSIQFLSTKQRSRCSSSRLSHLIFFKSRYKIYREKLDQQ